MGDNRGPQLLGVLVTLVTFVVPSVLLRCYTMGVILRRFYWEDWIAALCLILYILFTAFGILAVLHGVGAHVVDVSPVDRPVAIMYRWLAELLYLAISLLTKYIVGLFLLRICPNERWRQIIIWSLLGLTTLFDLFYLGLGIFSCQPITYEWTRYATPPPEGVCNANIFATVSAYVSGVLNIIVDWVLPLMPASLIWRTKMPFHQKMSVIALLALGSVASVATIVRIPYAKGILNQPDYLYNFTDLGIWSTVEIGVALTASSLATLKPLFRRMGIMFTTSVDDTHDTWSVAAGGSDLLSKGTEVTKASQTKAEAKSSEEGTSEGSMKEGGTRKEGRRGDARPGGDVSSEDMYEMDLEKAPPSFGLPPM